jgi:hypothetical protein
MLVADVAFVVVAVVAVVELSLYHVACVEQHMVLERYLLAI